MVASVLRLLVGCKSLQGWHRWSEDEIRAGGAWRMRWVVSRDLPVSPKPMGATLLGKSWRAAESCSMLAKVGNKLGFIPYKFEARRGPRVGKAAGTTDALAALKKSPTEHGKFHSVIAYLIYRTRGQLVFHRVCIFVIILKGCNIGRFSSAQL